ncbi:karyopherin (importin) beta 3 [Anaeramoeba ignava]|uniref:Karyopherin (Importin) beta 3 n=1 Tax=Anaeramoeba ignava TaxID=1746090 RepID=A0A9Q0L7A2_ANAIG|nr:karyopherin (importin) beta 3 [Anaeramoeba ignava]
MGQRKKTLDPHGTQISRSLKAFLPSKMNPQEFQQFEQLLHTLTIPNNKERQEAEDYYHSLFQKNADLCGLYLVSMLQSSSIKVKMLSMILLRQSIVSKTQNAWKIFSLETKQKIKSKLLEEVQTQPQVVKKKVANCIAAIGKIELGKGKWNELLQLTTQLIESSDPENVENGLYLIQQLSLTSGKILAKEKESLYEIFSKLIDKSYKISIRYSTLKAVASYVLILSNEDNIPFRKLIPEMIEVINEFLKNGDDDLVSDCLQELIETAELASKFFREHTEMVISLSGFIIHETEVETGIKNIAMELITIIAEKLTGVIKKSQNFFETAITSALYLIIQEADEELDELFLSDKSLETHVSYGENTLDRLSLILGGKNILPTLLKHLENFLNDQTNWKKRYSGLLSICSIGEGAKETIEERLEEFVQTIIPFFQDEQPQVRYAAVKTIGQMCSDFNPQLQLIFHEPIITAISGMLDEVEYPFLQAHACAALVNFCSETPSEIVEPYVDTLLKKLADILLNSKTMAKEQSMTAIAALASSTKTAFTKYYDELIPYLLNMMTTLTENQYNHLKGRALECITLIGCAVEPEKFENDAAQIIELMLELNSQKLEAGDRLRYYLLLAWGRVCGAMGAKFVPYLDKALPILYSSADKEIAIESLYDGEIEETMGGMNDGKALKDYTSFMLDGKTVGMRTSDIQEKATSVEILMIFASELSHNLIPYVQQIADIVIPLVLYYIDEDVRTYAAMCVGELVKCYASAFENGMDKEYQISREIFTNFFQVVLENLSQAAVQEPTTDVLFVQVQSIKEGLESAKNYVDSSSIEAFLEVFPQIIEASEERKQMLFVDEQDDDFCEETSEFLEEQKDDEDDLILVLTRCITPLVKYHRAKFLPFFKKHLLPVFEQYINPEFSDYHKQVSLCVFDEIVEFGGSSIFTFYWKKFGQYCMQYALSEHAGLRQSAVYGLGVCAQMGGASFAPFAQKALDILHSAVENQDAKIDDMEFATENAISAIAKICKFQSTNVDLNRSLPLWLSYLPVLIDKEESIVTYSLLCSFIEENNPFLLGNQNQNIPQILRIFCSVIETDLINKEISQRIANILSQIKSQFSQQQLEEILNSVGPKDFYQILLPFFK